MYSPGDSGSGFLRPRGKLYLKMSRPRRASLSKSENRTALLRITLASSVAEQFPISCKITFGGAPRGQAQVRKVLILGKKGETMLLRIVPNNPIGRTAQADQAHMNRVGNQVGKVARQSRRKVLVPILFGSSFNKSYPLRNAREEFIHSVKVFLFQIRELHQDLVLRHSRRQIGRKIVNCKAQTANARLAAHLSGIYRNPWVQFSHRRTTPLIRCLIV